MLKGLGVQVFKFLLLKLRGLRLQCEPVPPHLPPRGSRGPAGRTAESPSGLVPTLRTSGPFPRRSRALALDRAGVLSSLGALSPVLAKSTAHTRPDKGNRGAAQAAPGLAPPGTPAPAPGPGRTERTDLFHVRNKPAL